MKSRTFWSVASISDLPIRRVFMAEDMLFWAALVDPRHARGRWGLTPPRLNFLLCSCLAKNCQIIGWCTTLGGGAPSRKSWIRPRTVSIWGLVFGTLREITKSGISPRDATVPLFVWDFTSRRHCPTVCLLR